MTCFNFWPTAAKQTEESQFFCKMLQLTATKYRSIWHADVQFTVFEMSISEETKSSRAVPVERDPPDILSQHHTGRHQQFSKLTHVKSKFIVSLELYATVSQQIDRVLCIHVLADITTAHKLCTADINSARQQQIWESGAVGESKLRFLAKTNWNRNLGFYVQNRTVFVDYNKCHSVKR